jgi:hypothetical protein
VARDHGRGAVDELLCQPLVQRVREPVLDVARALLPEARLRHPARAVREVGPGADRGDARDQLVERGRGAVDLADLRGQEVLLDAAERPAQEAEDAREQPRVASLKTAWKSGTWQTSHSSRTDSASRASAAISPRLGERRERALVLGVAHAQQERLRRLALRGCRAGASGGEEVELVGPPERCESAAKRCDSTASTIRASKGAELGARPEAAVLRVAARAAGDLSDLRGQERAGPDAVVLPEAREDERGRCRG